MKVIDKGPAKPDDPIYSLGLVVSTQNAKRPLKSVAQPPAEISSRKPRKGGKPMKPLDLQNLPFDPALGADDLTPSQ